METDDRFTHGQVVEGNRRHRGTSSFVGIKGSWDRTLAPAARSPWSRSIYLNEARVKEQSAVLGTVRDAFGSNVRERQLDGVDDGGDGAGSSV